MFTLKYKCVVLLFFFFFFVIIICLYLLTSKVYSLFLLFMSVQRLKYYTCGNNMINNIYSIITDRDLIPYYIISIGYIYDVLTHIIFIL